MQRIYSIVYLKLPEELWLSRSCSALIETMPITMINRSCSVHVQPFLCSVLTTSLHPDATCLSSFLFLVLNSTFPVYFSRICATKLPMWAWIWAILASTHKVIELCACSTTLSKFSSFEFFHYPPLLLCFSEFHIAQFHHSWWYTLPIPHSP